VRAIETSFATTCIVDLLGGAQCWGRNDSGQLAIGSTTNLLGPQEPTEPVRDASMSNLENIKDVAIGDRHTCFLLTGGSLYCAGSNSNGQLGVGGAIVHPYADQLLLLSNVTNVDVAHEHSCAISDNTVYCWGDNQLGQVNPEDAGVTAVYSPGVVSGVGSATAVATGRSFACALTTTGNVMCWGSREKGAIGDGVGVSSDITTPVMVPGLSNVVAIDASYEDEICALNMSGELYCWGEDAVAMLPTIPIGAATTFLDGEVLHTAPVRVDPL
jgi:alpha-tubulin suppressor-like RCC1 family protein